MPLKRDDKNFEFLFKAILELQDIDAKMLSEKSVYTDIVNETGAWTATISRVNRSLQYGCDGYDKVFKRLGEKESDEAL